MDGKIYTLGTWVSGTAISLPALQWRDTKCPSDFDTYKALLQDDSQASQTENTGNLDAISTWVLKVEFAAVVKTNN